MRLGIAPGDVFLEPAGNSTRRRGSGQFRTGMTMAALGVLLLAGRLPAAEDQQRPVLKSGVDLVAVDVQIVDGSGRPVADLRPSDFDVSLGGRRREVVSAELVRYRSAGAAAGEPAGSSPAAAGPSPAAPRRMYMIGVDEHSIRFGAARAAMEAARRFIARLGPDDLVGLYAYPTGTARVDLTTDHAQVLAALDTVMALFEPPRSAFRLSASEAIDIASGDRQTTQEILERECRDDPYCRRQLPLDAQGLAIAFEMTVAQSLGGLRQLLDGLGTIPGRKVLVLVSGGLMITDRGSGRVNEAARMAEVGELAARSDVTLYALHMDTRFQDAFAERPSRTQFRDEGMFVTGLERVAGAAGGTVFRLQTGSGDPAFDRVLLETSAHYVLGVVVADEDRDGKPKNIRVQVKRRGATVRARSAVVVPVTGTAPTASPR